MLTRSASRLLITVLAACATGMVATQAGADDTLSVDDALVRAMPATAAVTAAYLVIHNHGSKTEVLTGISASDFARAELHTSSTVDGRMSMRRLSTVKIPARGSLAFRQGSLHIMLYQPNRVLQPGEVVKLILEFSSGRTISVDAPVRDLRQMHHQDHHQH